MIERYKEILKQQGVTGKQMAEKLGVTYDSYRSMTKNTASQYPKWMLAFIIGHELSNK